MSLERRDFISLFTRPSPISARSLEKYFVLNGFIPPPSLALVKIPSRIVPTGLLSFPSTVFIPPTSIVESLRKDPASPAIFLNANLAAPILAHRLFRYIILLHHILSFVTEHSLLSIISTSTSYLHSSLTHRISLICIVKSSVNECSIRGFGR